MTMITLKQMLIERKVNAQERLGCLMAMVDKEYAKLLQQVNHKLIPDEDLYHRYDEKDEDEFGREKESHVTIRYGFTKDLNELQVRQLLKGQKEFYIELQSLDTFNTNPEFDVVKFNVKSDVLNKLNEESGKYPNKSDFPNYHPHLTLAYVKKGTFPNTSEGFNIKIPIKSVCYSPISGAKSYYDLNEGQLKYTDIDAKIQRLEQEWDRLDSMGGISIDRQHEIEHELDKLRRERARLTYNIKGKIYTPSDPKSKELWKQVWQGLSV